MDEFYLEGGEALLSRRGVVGGSRTRSSPGRARYQDPRLKVSQVLDHIFKFFQNDVTSFTFSVLRKSFVFLMRHLTFLSSYQITVARLNLTFK